jgi:hypothetical protein
MVRDSRGGGHTIFQRFAPRPENRKSMFSKLFRRAAGRNDVIYVDFTDF